MNQLLARLKRDLDRASDPSDRAELAARVAGNLARLGQFPEARQLITSLRQQFGKGQSGRVTVWLMLAEGLIYHYEDLSPAAMGRIRGAQALGLAMGYSTIVALASAWKAHIEFERSDFESMIESLDIALKNVEDSEYDALTRLAIVLSNAFMIAGDRDQGQLWFKSGHAHAVQNGDQASIDALLYNRAAFHLSSLRALNCRLQIPSDALTSARMEIASAKNLQHLLGVSALEGHVRLLDARLQLLEAKYESAISALQLARGAAPFAPHNFDQEFIELEVGFAKMMLGDVESALMHVPSLAIARFEALDIDERLVASWMLLKMSAIDPRVGSEGEYSKHFESLWVEYIKGCEFLRSRLTKFECK